MKRLMMAGWCVAAVAAALADTWYVDDDNYGNSGNGTSAAAAFGTIQEAMDNSSLKSGDTVILMPGTYDQGSDVTTGGQGMAARVVVKKANITIRSSTGKAEDVHIVGQLDNSEGNDHGMGSSSMRCIADTGVAGVVVHGVTIRNGSTVPTILNKGTPDGRGGGIFSSAHGRITIIDCVVSNCAAMRSGGAHQVTAHSTLFTGNYIGGNNGSAIGYGSAANCLIAYNTTSSQYPMAYMYNVVNCTIARNALPNASKGGLNNNAIDGAAQRFCNVLAFGECRNTASGANVYSGVFASNPVFATTNEVTVTEVDPAGECVAPVLGDWRPLSTGHCPNRGRGEYLLYVPMPEGYTYHDMAGNEVPTNGPVSVGAFQEVVTPAAARIVFNTHGSDYNYTFTVEGAAHPVQKSDWINPLSWPIVYKVKYNHPRMFSIYATDEQDAGAQYPFMRHVLYDGWARYMPHPDTSQTATLRGYIYTDAFYADAVNGSDDYDGSSPTPVGGGSTVGPKKTLQAAVNLASNEVSVVYAAPGTYDEGGSYFGSISNRVYMGKQIGLIASGGQGTATIVGAPDPSTGSFGPNAMRCVYLGSKHAFMQGFNLTGGYTDLGTSNPARGAAYFGNGFEPQVLDCIVTGNTGDVGIGGGGTAMRTRFCGNSTSNYVIRSGLVVNCLLSGNAIRKSPFSPSCLIYACTVDCEGYADGGGGFGASASAFFNAATYGSIGTSICNAVCVAGYFADATNVNPLSRDFRLGALASAVGAVSTDGLLANVGTYPELRQFVMADIDGREPLFYAGGSMDAGAVWSADKLPMYALDGVGGGAAVEGGSLTNVISETTQITAFATDAVGRPFLGFELNGVMQPLVSTSFVFTASAEPGIGTLVRAIYGTNWYVNASSGDNSDFGSTPETARRTLKSVAEHAMSGDTIHAAEGRYDEGEMLHTSALYSKGDGITIPSRVLVKSGVTLVADGAAENTFIVGANSADEGRDEWNCGEGAVRCVALQADASIRGFTLMGGRTAVRLDDKNKALFVDDGGGAGVLGGDRDTSIADGCIISNNVACFGGAGAKCTFRRCLIFENTGSSRAGVGRSCSFYRCLIDRNRSTYQIEGYGIIDSCTIGPDSWRTSGSNASQSTLYNSAGPVVNSLVLAQYISNAIADHHIYGSNSVFRTGCGVQAADLTNCIVTNLAAIALDDDWRPVIGANVGIDRADETLSNAYMIGDTDLSGAQGVMNGARDIGAFEADWRARYAADIGSGCTVPAVSPEVYENAAGHVFLPAGALTASFAATTKQTRRTLAFAVMGSGTLSVSVNGVVVGEFTSASEQNCTFVLPAAGGTIALAYEPGENDAGGAEILSCARLTGTSFVFR